MNYSHLLCHTLAALGLGAFSTVSAKEPSVTKVKQTLDIRYADESGDRHLLDVFAPEDAKGRPVVVLVHGGSWMLGDKNFFGLYRDVGKELARQGIVAVLPNYRLTPWVKHPEHAKDIAAVFAWTRKSIDKHGGNADNIVLCGHSAGGHLVSLVATDESYLKEESLKLTDKDRRAIRGVIGISAVYNIPGSDAIAKVMEKMVGGLAMEGKDKGAMPAMASAALRQTGLLLNPFKMTFGTDPKQHQMASPLYHVREGLPPFLVLYAEAELPLLDQMAKDFGTALKKAKNEVEVMQIDKRNHNSILFRASSADDPVLKKIVKFVERPSP